MEEFREIVCEEEKVKSPRYTLGAMLVGMAVVSIMAAGCARTSITSRVSDELRHRKYYTILVIAAIHDLELKEAMEDKISKSLDNYGIRGFQDNHEFFPGTTYLLKDYSYFLKQRRVDGVLVIIPVAYGTAQAYIPPTTTSQAHGSLRSDGFGGFYYGETTESSTSGGYNVSKPWASFMATLYDARQGDAVWYATANTAGNALASNKTLLRSMGGKTVKQLHKDGLLE